MEKFENTFNAPKEVPESSKESIEESLKEIRSQRDDIANVLVNAEKRLNNPNINLNEKISTIIKNGMEEMTSTLARLLEQEDVLIEKLGQLNGTIPQSKKKDFDWPAEYRGGNNRATQ